MLESHGFKEVFFVFSCLVINIDCRSAVMTNNNDV